MTGPTMRVDTASPVPPYEQIRAQLATLISSGRLPEGERLPTIRQLASDLVWLLARSPGPTGSWRAPP